MKTKLIDLPRYHIFRWDKTLFLLNENIISIDDQGTTHYFWEFHRVYKDGRTSYGAYRLNNRDALIDIEVEDLGDIYDWMKMNHPIRYKRENWEASRPKKED